MKKGSTLFLKAALLVVGAVALLVCILGVPSWRTIGGEAEYKDIAGAFYGLLATMYAAAIPFFFALSQAWLLLTYVDKNKAFSKLAVRALQRIVYSAVIISIILTSSIRLFYVWAQHDDAPGLVVIGMALAAAPLVVAVFAGVLQRLFQEAMVIKSENDLTV